MTKFEIKFNDYNDYSEYITKDTHKKVSELKKHFAVVVGSYAGKEIISVLGVYENAANAEMALDAVSNFKNTYARDDDLDVVIEECDKNGSYSFWY